LTLEEAYLAAKFFKGLGNVTLALGIVPTVGADDHYPKDRHGQPVQPTKFTIRAEKCPNRRGVSAVLQKFQGEIIPVGTALAQSWSALWVTTGYPRGTGYPLATSPYTAEHAAKVANVPLVVVQDMFASALGDAANYLLPSAAWSEKDGTFLNHAGLAQTLSRANHLPGEARSEGQVFAELLGKRGLFRSVTVRPELAAEMPEFAGLPMTPEKGLKLELPLVNGMAKEAHAGV
jgi:NADH-quinone oxidoreductase subunit G